MGTPLIDFLTSIIAFEIGLLLFFLNRKYKVTKFVESVTMLLLMMAPATLIIPLLAPYQGYIYFFLPIYIIAINGWLFFTRNIIFGKIDWQIETIDKKGVRKIYLILAFGFVSVLILLITFAPHKSVP